jgi:C_GCAxxG_C_C family probable redox protein
LPLIVIKLNFGERLNKTLLNWITFKIEAILQEKWFVGTTKQSIIMTKSEDAKEVFAKGFNCAQSILFTYGKDYFKENTTALKLASGFGAGISYRGEICGAVSGSLMVIGLLYGYSDLTIVVSKEMTFKVAHEFMETFEKCNGSVICNQLIKSEINTPEGLEYARQNGLFKKICPKLVESASEILETLIQKYPTSNLKNN